MNKKEYNYNGIDLFKFFFSLCVVACHVHPYDIQISAPFSLYSFLNVILNTAVPFFFISNGFFIKKKIHGKFESGNIVVIKTILKKYIILYLVWTAIYMPITIYYYAVSNLDFLRITFNFIDGLIFTGEHWYSWNLWYLCSLIWALVIFVIFGKAKNADKKICVVSLILFICAFAYGHFFSSCNFLPIKIFNVIFGSTGRQFTAPLYLLIGILLDKKRYSWKSGVVLVIVGLAISPLFPTAGYGYYSEPNLLLIATGIFIISTSINFPNNKMFFFLRTSSMVLYFTHLFVYIFICLVFFKTIFDGLQIYLTVVSICLLLAIPIFLLEKNNNKLVGLLFYGRWKN